MNQDLYKSILNKLWQLLSWSQDLEQELEMELSLSYSQELEQELDRLLSLSLSYSQKLSCLQELEQKLEHSQQLWHCLKLFRWLEQWSFLYRWLKHLQWAERRLEQELSLSLENSKVFVWELFDEFEETKLPNKDREQVNDANAASYAVKLPYLIKWLNQETQTWLIDMRIAWYKDRPLKRKTHIDVWLKTYRYFILDHSLFRLWDKITSRSLYRDRILRVKDSE